MTGATSADLETLIMDEKDKAWFAKTESAQAILDAVRQGNGSLRARLLPGQVVLYGHWVGHRLAKKEKLKYAQLRRFVNALKEIQALRDFGEQRNRLTLFQIHLVHGYSRQPKLEPFFTLVKGLVADESLIKDKEDVDRFMALIEAITAYFEIHGGKKDED